jgi:zinc transport system substrate-binding protein
MKRKNRSLEAFLAAALLASLMLFSVSCTRTETTDARLRAVATIFPVYDMARAVGGEDVTVDLLVPPGTEAHTFEPTPSDIVRLEEADVFIYNGANMEPWVGGILAGIKNPNLLVVDTSTGITLLTGKGDKNKGVDPHVWLDFDNAKKQVDAITAAFIKKDGAHEAAYRTRADEYNNRLDELDKLYRKALADCETRVIVSSGHLAFGYLAARYNLAVVSAFGLSPDAEPTPSRIVELIDLVKKEKVRYLFAEEMVDPRLTETIREETGAEILYVSSGHDLPKERFNRGVTLPDLMKENLEKFKRGLSCR